MSDRYVPTVAQARAQLDAPLDPDLEFASHSRSLAEAERDGRIEPLTSQERTFISLHRMGLTWQQAARGAGMTVQQARLFGEDPRYKAAADIVAEMQQSHIIVTKDLLTFQYYEAMGSAETAAEKIRGLDSIAKLHEIGGFARAPQQGTVAGGVIEGEKGLSAEAKRKKLANMSTDRLLIEAGIEEGFFDPVPVSRERK